ncbi:MAG: DUF4350 domain-containing protein [Gemmatimonadota bacterium]
MAGSRPAAPQQIADSAFAPAIGRPTFAPGSGPVVLVDEGHHNFHTIGGRYLAFARLLERDGYVVRPSSVRFTGPALRKGAILVIANALHDTGQWVLPARSAFTPAEVSAVARWVRAGGSLFLIVDHMPMPGAASSLAAAFGVRFYNGFAMSLPDSNSKFVFHRENGKLADHAVTRGRSVDERVDSVVSFTGQAFRIPPTAVPILTVDSNVSVLLTKTAWEFLPSTPKVSGKGLVQGALLQYGKGRVAVFGEAAMFSAQLAGAHRSPMGMNDPKAPENPRFLLNVVRWLAGVAEPGIPPR